MGVKRSILWTLVAGVSLAGACIIGVQAVPQAHAQTRQLATFTPRTISGTYSENLGAMRDLDTMTANLAEFVQPGVVHIRSESKEKRDLGGNRLPAMGGTGSGVIYRPDGYILTNDHVVGGFDTVTVVLQDGRELEGKVTRAEDVDLAVVKVDAKDLPTLPFGDSSKVRPGQFSMAVGSPFGLDNTVTFGHISAIGRTDSIRDSRLSITRNYPDLIQTDTPINMGNSGGPLINVEGQVIGINTAIFSPTGVNNGIGFAIPSNTARLIADKLILDGKIQRGALGLRPSTLKGYLAKEMGLSGGAYVEDVVNGTPAADAGIKKGDVIVRIGNIPVKTETDVRDSMLNYAPGEKVQIQVVRDKTEKSFNVTLTTPDKLPQDPAQVQPQAPGDVTPFEKGLSPDFPNFEDLKKLFPNTPEEPGSSEKSNRSGPVRLGVMVQDANAAMKAQFGIPEGTQGAVVTTVDPGSVADRLGLKPGDVIEKIGGKAIANGQDLKSAVQACKWGQPSSIKFTRYGDHSVISQEFPFKF